MERFLYYLGCLVAIVLLQSIPRFLFETSRDVLILEHAVLFLLFLGVAWFFRHVLHGDWNWGVLSGMFFVESIAAVSFAVLLFLQLFSPWWMVVTGAVLLARCVVYAYLVTQRLMHLKGLVFFSCLLLLVCGELILTYSVNFF